MNHPELDASEGDVETQVVLPLLTAGELLGIPREDVRSKEGISATDIGKGTKRKIGYIPDFSIYKLALPVAVIEAKARSGDVEKAYGEARLYALEINRSFPTGCNPCSRVLATDGATILAGGLGRRSRGSGQSRGPCRREQPSRGVEVNPRRRGSEPARRGGQ